MSKIAFVFPGQGAQYVGMGKDLYENSEIARKEFDKIFNELDFDLKTIMFEGPEEKLKETRYTQPAIVTLSLVLTKILEDMGINPDIVAGHSVGEYAAFGASGVLSYSDDIKLTALRGKYMDEISKKVDGSMAAVIGLEANKIEEVLENIDGICEAVNYNEPKQTVIAGEDKAIDEACVALKEAGARRAMKLKVAGPFHSILMKEAGEKLKEKLDDFDFHLTNIILIGNTSARPLTSIEEIKEEIYKQSFGPVKWVDTIHTMKDMGVDTIYEIGPGKVLSGLIRKIDKEILVKNIEKLEDLENIM